MSKKNSAILLWDLLSSLEKRQGVQLIGLVIFMAIFDVAGVASIMPFLAVLADPGSVQTNPFLNTVFTKSGIQSIDTFLLFLGVTVFLALVISIAFKAFTTYRLLKFTYFRNYSISTRLIKGYFRQPYEWFLSRNSSELGSSILSEVQQVVDLALVPAVNLFANGSISLALLGLLVFADPFLAFIVGSILVLSYGAVYLGTRKYLGKIGGQRIEANNERFRAVNEAFLSIKMAKLMGIENYFLKNYEVPAKRFANYTTGAQIAAHLPRYVLELVSFGGMIAVILVLMLSGKDFVSALPLIGLYAFAGFRLMPALQQVYYGVSTLRYSSAAIEKLSSDIRMIESSAQSIPNGLGITVLDSIVLHEVSYSYPNQSELMLSKQSMKIKKGSIIGLVGATGSGKSTIIDLLMGLLVPQEGTLQIDGTAVSGYNLAAWQKSIGYVPQEILLSDFSIAENIALGNEIAKIDFDRVAEVAQIACIHEFVQMSLPDKYYTKVGERGTRLSGGQRQRIGLARALYCRPKLLILDEATSALDVVTERTVIKSILKCDPDMTIVMIAHRFSTLENCDTIFVVENGRLTSNGDYLDMLKNNASHFTDIDKSKNR
ncbi:ATP-binding cassette domain-containing protein [bacterium]|nr:ATP-binding cassette domain-containing protein [bacterium]